MRQFTGHNDWNNGRIQITRAQPSNATFSERFTYVRKSADSFNLVYETTRDASHTWHMGDTVLCSRQR
jgi:hypothetical protein